MTGITGADRLIPTGSYLLVENLDRLTRGAPWDALGLLRDIVTAGVRIVVLTPWEMVIDREAGINQLMPMLMELSRGNGESVRKRELSGENWQRWKDTAALTKEVRPTKPPFWVVRRGVPAVGRAKGQGHYELDEAGAAVVRLAFQLAADGWGAIRIAQHFRELGVRPITVERRRNPDGWISPAYLAQLFLNPAVYGRCKALGVDDYWPAAVTTELFYRVQLARKHRRRGSGGGKKKFVHLLSGLVKNMETGVGYTIHYPFGSKCRTKVYQPMDYKGGGETELTSFPVHALELAVCACLKELDLDALASPQAGGIPARLGALEGEAETLRGRVAEAEREMADGGELAVLAKLVRQWTARVEVVQTEIDALRAEAGNPLGDTLTEAQRFMSAIDAIPEDELRLRVCLVGTVYN